MHNSLYTPLHLRHPLRLFLVFNDPTRLDNHIVRAYRLSHVVERLFEPHPSFSRHGRIVRAASLEAYFLGDTLLCEQLGEHVQVRSFVLDQVVGGVGAEAARPCRPARIEMRAKLSTWRRSAF